MAFSFVGLVFVLGLWSDGLAPRRKMRRIADELGWEPSTRSGFEAPALRGDSHLSARGYAKAYDLLKGPDGVQVFRVVSEGGQWVVAQLPLHRPSPYLAVTANRRVGRLPAPKVGRTVAVGDREFDARFRTLSESPTFARALLTPSVRALIAAHPEYALRIDGCCALAFRASPPTAAVVTALVDFLDDVVTVTPDEAWPVADTAPADRPAPPDAQ